MNKNEDRDSADDVEDDDEPMWWDVVEERYGRPLTEGEWRAEIKSDYEAEYIELTEDELLQNLQKQKDWAVLKAEIAAYDGAEEHSKKAAEEFLDLALCPPINDNGFVDEIKYENWVKEINEHIRTSMDFYAIGEVIRLSNESAAKTNALKNALKRHAEHHALRDDVYKWADLNIKPGQKLDDAASEIAGKVVPLTWRTVRAHLTKWKKLRSASIP